MEKIYLVIGSAGEYDDYFEWAERAFFDETAAQLYALTLNERSERLTKIITKFYELLHEWEKENPRTDMARPHSQEYYKLLKRKKKKTITNEESRRLDVLEAEEQDFNSRFRAWYDKYAQAQTDIISKLDMSEEDRVIFTEKRGVARNSYSVSEVEIE